MGGLFLEKIINFYYYLDGLVTELDNQQDAITNSVDELGDDGTGLNPRSDAPTLTGQHVAQLRAFAANMRDQVSASALDILVSLAVRDVNTIIRN